MNTGATGATGATSATGRRFIAKHAVVVYFAITFAISWGGALLAIGGAGGMRGTTPASDPRFAYALLALLAIPACAYR